MDFALVRGTLFQLIFILAGVLTLLNQDEVETRQIATFDDLVFLWEQLQLLSGAAPHINQSIVHHGTLYKLCLQTLPRRQRLETLWAYIRNNEKLESWATVLQRLCQAS